MPPSHSESWCPHSPVHPNPWHDTLCHHKPPYIFPQNSHHTYLSRHFHSLSEIYCHATSTSSLLDLHVIHVPATLAATYIAYIMIVTSSLCFEYLLKCERSSIPSCKLECCP